jgi:hypothetical protein
MPFVTNGTRGLNFAESRQSSRVFAADLPPTIVSHFLDGQR